MGENTRKIRQDKFGVLLLGFYEEFRCECFKSQVLNLKIRLSMSSSKLGFFTFSQHQSTKKLILGHRLTKKH